MKTYFFKEWSKNQILIFVVCSLLIVVKWVMSIHFEDTYDEDLHRMAGYLWLKENQEKTIMFTNSMMPVSAFNMLPIGILKAMHIHLQKSTFDLISKSISIFPYLGIISLIFFWLKKYFHLNIALISIIFFALDPNIVAYSNIVGTDVWGTFAAVYILYSFYRFEKNQTLKNFIIFSFAIAFAQLCKQFNIWFYPLTFIYILFFYKNFKHLKFSYLVYFAFIQIVVIAAGFKFVGFGATFSEYHFFSSTFSKLQQISFLQNIPLPFAKPFVQGLDMVSAINAYGGGNNLDERCTFGSSYVLEQIRPMGAFWYYFFVVLFFKTPIPILILFFTSLLKFKTYWWKPFRYISIFVVFILIYLNFFYKVQIGVRHILVFYPMLFLVLSPFVYSVFLTQYSKFLYILLVWNFISILPYFNDFIPYTNEFIWNKKYTNKIFIDCNLSWGQNRKRAIQLSKDSNYILEPNNILEGKILVDAGSLRENGQGHKYCWIYENYKPIRHFYYTHLLYDIPASDTSFLRKKYFLGHYKYMTSPPK